MPAFLSLVHPDHTFWLVRRGRNPPRLIAVTGSRLSVNSVTSFKYNEALDAGIILTGMLADLPAAWSNEAKFGDNEVYCHRFSETSVSRAAPQFEEAIVQPDQKTALFFRRMGRHAASSVASTPAMQTGPVGSDHRHQFITATGDGAGARSYGEDRCVQAPEVDTVSNKPWRTS